MEVEAITLIAGFGVIVCEKIYKRIKYTREKRKLKKKLVKAIQENDKNNIKKYIIKLKDFDKRYRKEKLLKTLEYCFRTINDLKEDNLYSLMDNFNFIDMIYESEDEELNLNIHNNLNERLRKLEKKRKEILIRNNQIQARNLFKNSKMEKNMKKKKKKGKLG